jgi:hypothetical protein
VSAAAIGKEVRALLPAFAAALVTIMLATQTDAHVRLRLLLFVACLGPIALGSMSIGHEYAYRTLTLMLGQPIARARLFATKAAVLLPMVAAIAIAVFFALPEGLDRFEGARGQTGALLILAPLCGLCLAPALSMMCRSPLAAIVFTIAVPALVTMAAQIAGTATHGFRNPRAVNEFAFAVTWPVIALLCLAGGLLTWHLFRRLQAVEGLTELELPSVLRSEAARRPVARVHGPWSALIRKELRLQQLAYVVAFLYAIAASGIWGLQVYAPEFPRIRIEALSMMYSGLLAILIGAVASAEERQLGTLAAQLLQPIAVWKQWAVKVGTVVGLSLLLAIALPLLVSALIETPDTRLVSAAPHGVRHLQRALVPMIVLTSASLYVSSLSSSGIRAMIASIPAIVAGGLVSMVASSSLMSATLRAVRDDVVGSPQAERVAAYRTIQSMTDAGLLVSLVLFAATAFWLGYANHRRLDRSPSTLLVQVVILAAVVAGIAVLPMVVFLTMRPGA